MRSLTVVRTQEPLDIETKLHFDNANLLYIVIIPFQNEVIFWLVASYDWERVSDQHQLHIVCVLLTDGRCGSWFLRGIATEMRIKCGRRGEWIKHPSDIRPIGCFNRHGRRPRRLTLWNQRTTLDVHSNMKPKTSVSVSHRRRVRIGIFGHFIFTGGMSVLIAHDSWNHKTTQKHKSQIDEAKVRNIKKACPSLRNTIRCFSSLVFFF